MRSETYMSKINLQSGILTVENRRSREKKQICSEVSVNSPGNPWSQSRRRNGRLWWEGFMTRVTCRLTAKNRDQLRNPIRSAIEYGLPLPFSVPITVNASACRSLSAFKLQKINEAFVISRAFQFAGPSPNSPSLLFEYQCRCGKFIRLANRIKSKKSIRQLESNRIETFARIGML